MNKSGMEEEGIQVGNSHKRGQGGKWFEERGNPTVSDVSRAFTMHASGRRQDEVQIAGRPESPASKRASWRRRVSSKRARGTWW